MEHEMYIQCPEVFSPENIKSHRRTLFLGGGITGTQEWQESFAEKLSGCDLIVFNPLRNNFDVTDPDMTEFQIEWEFFHLRLSRARLFWFPPETLCPITLFELGKYCEKTDPLFVGCHPKYQRKVDLQIQLRLSRPWDCIVSSSLDVLASRIRKWAKK